MNSKLILLAAFILVVLGVACTSILGRPSDSDSSRHSSAFSDSGDARSTESAARHKDPAIHKEEAEAPQGNLPAAEVIDGGGAS